MLNIYLSDSGRMLEQDQILPGSWINLCDPNEKEIGRVCAQLHVDPDLVRAALDEEERSRIEAVSYTHLDVYKRQTQGGGALSPSQHFNFIKYIPLCEFCQGAGKGQYSPL